GHVAAGPASSGRISHPGRTRHGPDGAVRQPRGRHVWRQTGRGGSGAENLQRSPTSVHPVAHQEPAKPHDKRGFPRHPWTDAVAANAASRLHVPSPLPTGDATLFGRRSGPGRSRTGALGSLPSLRREPGLRFAPRGAAGVSGLLEARNVTRVFGGGLLSKGHTVAVDDVSLLINEDNPSITAIAGESGSGKTTLARLLLGVIQPTGGSI